MQQDKFSSNYFIDNEDKQIGMTKNMHTHGLRHFFNDVFFSFHFIETNSIERISCIVNCFFACLLDFRLDMRSG